MVYNKPKSTYRPPHAGHLIYIFWHIYDNLGHLRATFLLTPADWDKFGFGQVQAGVYVGKNTEPKVNANKRMR